MMMKAPPQNGTNFHYCSQTKSPREGIDETPLNTCELHSNICFLCAAMSLACEATLQRSAAADSAAPCARCPLKHRITCCNLHKIPQFLHSMAEDGSDWVQSQVAHGVNDMVSPPLPHITVSQRDVLVTGAATHAYGGSHLREFGEKA